jgi:hypothetical protein
MDVVVGKSKDRIMKTKPPTFFPVLVRCKDDHKETRTPDKEKVRRINRPSVILGLLLCHTSLSESAPTVTMLLSDTCLEGTTVGA